MESKKLAKELLIERIKSYMHGNPRGMPGAAAASQWYPECLSLAEAIIKVSG